VTRCVRKAFLLGEGDNNRKERWLIAPTGEFVGVWIPSGFPCYDALSEASWQVAPEDILGWFQQAGLCATHG
jgi:hypothetical protein